MILAKLVEYLGRDKTRCCICRNPATDEVEDAEGNLFHSACVRGLVELMGPGGDEEEAFGDVPFVPHDNFPPFQWRKP